jgi:hypothetical protein
MYDEGSEDHITWEWLTVTKGEMGLGTCRRSSWLSLLLLIALIISSTVALALIAARNIRTYKQKKKKERSEDD